MSRCKADATGVNDPPPPPRVYLITKVCFYVKCTEISFVHTYFYFIFFHSISTRIYFTLEATLFDDVFDELWVAKGEVMMVVLGETS